MGRGQETIRRDRKGRRLEMLEQMERQDAGIKEETTNYQWGRGEAQKATEEEQRRRLEEEKEKPFARHADDPQMNQWMKEASRWGDPMANMASVSKRKSKVYQGWAPPNRFGIKPSAKWDGVDRSNGFEAAFFAKQTQANLTAQEAYKWSTSDM